MIEGYDAWLAEHHLEGIEALTVKQCASTGVAERTIRRYIADGTLPTTTVKGARGSEHRIKPTDLYRVLSERSGAIERANSSPMQDMAASIDTMRQTIERLEAEQRDTRHQLHQMHEQLIHALMPRQPEPAPEIELTDEQAAKLTEIEDRLTRVVDKLDRRAMPFWQRLTTRRKD